MSEREISPWLKQSLEFGPVLAFFVAFFLLKAESYPLLGQMVQPFTFITFWFVILMVVSMGILRVLTGHLSRMQIMTLGLVVVMGGLTVWLDDERFLKLKPTLLYAAFSAILAFGLWQGKSYLASLLGDILPMEQEGWMVLTRRFAWFFLALAVANTLIAITLSSAVWVSVKTFGLPLAMVVFMGLQYKLVEKFGLMDDADPASPNDQD
ncbi:septation protein IspZ [Gymnodinialimonas sp. 57CJ19]|uniref:inner membrane-spanning protein YciB n=1 Tax=Gymnodinialimonas sp. 57CJ19 TaxID=3138498 RepID=UPI0031344575